MSDQEFIFAPPTVAVRFEIHPVDLQLNSLILLNQVEVNSGLAAWVEQTRSALTVEQMATNRLVFQLFKKGIDYDARPASFPDYIAQVGAIDPVVLRDHILDGLVAFYQRQGVEPADDLHAAMLSDRRMFMQVIEKTYGAKYAQKGLPLDTDLYRRAHALLTDPAGLKDLIIDHMQMMWDVHLRAEWSHNRPLLEESVDAFRKLDYSGMTAQEAVRTVTGRDLSGVWPQLDEATAIVFMPSPHIGPYVSYYTMYDVSYVIYGLRVPEGVQAQSAELSRSELLTRLNALADDTRLAILELLTHHDELFAQDIMNQLNLSQSSASRHLRQLSATGFLNEKRREVAKYYSLNLDRVEDTLEALRRFVRA
jgi:DNA-binding transcriptional ArsR family regulator